MEIRSDRRWAFAVPPSALWATIADVARYRQWWPWLRRFDADAFAAGETWHCTVQPPLPYTLRFRLELDEVEPDRFAVARIAGDIAGTARLDIAETDAGCDVRLVSTLAPSNGALRLIATVARPIARFGHDWVLDTGARQFAARLE